MADTHAVDPGFWGTLIAGVSGFGTSVAALFKARDLRQRIHKTAGIAQTAILETRVNTETIKGISARLDRIEDKLDHLIERGQ